MELVPLERVRGLLSESIWENMGMCPHDRLHGKPSMQEESTDWRDMSLSSVWDQLGEQYFCPFVVHPIRWQYDQRIPNQSNSPQYHFHALKETSAQCRPSTVKGKWRSSSFWEKLWRFRRAMLLAWLSNKRWKHFLWQCEWFFPLANYNCISRVAHVEKSLGEQ